MLKEGIFKLLKRYAKNLDIGGKRAASITESMAPHKRFMEAHKELLSDIVRTRKSSETAFSAADKVKKHSRVAHDFAMDQGVKFSKELNLHLKQKGNPNYKGWLRTSEGALSAAEKDLDSIKKTRSRTGKGLTIGASGLVLSGAVAGARRLLKDPRKEKHAAPKTTFTATNQSMSRMPQLKPPTMPGQLGAPRPIISNAMGNPVGVKPPVPTPVAPKIGGNLAGKFGVPSPTKSFGGAVNPGRVLS